MGQELAAHDDLDAVALGVGFPGRVHVEVDGARDAVARIPSWISDLKVVPVNVDQLCRSGRSAGRSATAVGSEPL